MKMMIRSTLSLLALILLPNCDSVSATGPSSLDGGMVDSSLLDSGISTDAEVPISTDAGELPPDAGPIDAEIVVTWRIPTEGATVSGLLSETNGNCVAEATSSARISQVDFYLDEVLLNTERGAPYACRWDTTTYPPGDHVLKAVAVDDAGRSASASINVIVERALGRTFYVSSAAGNDSNDGSRDRPWKTVSKVTAMAPFRPGDAVEFSGDFHTETLKDPGIGTAEAPITFVGRSGAGEGRARIRNIELNEASHVVFANFEAEGPNSNSTVQEGNVWLIRAPMTDCGHVANITFRNLKLHKAARGAVLGRYRGSTPCSTCKVSDVTFEDTQISDMFQDGILLDDKCVEKLSFIRGSITYTGKRPYEEAKSAMHGVYASGGHGHLFDGVTFRENQNGASLSIRRGNIIVRNCIFNGCGGENTPDGVWDRIQRVTLITNVNEDEGGATSSNLTYEIYRNLFLGQNPACHALVQGAKSGDPGALSDPHNSWAIFNNTFVNATVHFGATHAQLFDIYMRNNVFDHTYVKMSVPTLPHVHEMSNNLFFNATLNGSSREDYISAQSPRSMVSTSAPFDPSTNSVTLPLCKDAGTTSIIPQRVVMTASDPNLGFIGPAPDIGHTER